MCPRAHGLRVGKHDRLVVLVQSAAGKASWSCIRKPVIPTIAGLRRMDLIFYHPDRPTLVLDITVVADNAVSTSRGARAQSPVL